MTFTYKDHMFLPGHTIEAIIRNFNDINSDRNVIDVLVDEFNSVNNHEMPSPGSVFKIPIIDK